MGLFRSHYSRAFLYNGLLDFLSINYLKKNRWVDTPWRIHVDSMDRLVSQETYYIIHNFERLRVSDLYFEEKEKKNSFMITTLEIWKVGCRGCSFLTRHDKYRGIAGFLTSHHSFTILLAESVKYQRERERDKMSPSTVTILKSPPMKGGDDEYSYTKNSTFQVIILHLS